MFENELFLVVRLQHNGVLVEGPNASAKLYPAHEINRDGRLVFASSVEKGVLNILCRLGFHCADLSLIQNPAGTAEQQHLKIEPRERSWQIGSTK